MLKRIRSVLGLTQKELARASDLSIQTIRRFEHGTAGRLSPAIERAIINANQMPRYSNIKDWNQFLTSEILELEDEHGITIEAPPHRPLSENYEYWKTLCRMLVSTWGVTKPDIDPAEDHEAFRQEFMARLFDAGYKFDIQTNIASLASYSQVMRVHLFSLLQFETAQEDGKNPALPVELQQAFKEVFPLQKGATEELDD